MTEFKHVPIMLDEVLSLLEPERGGVFIDGTLGGGGHAEAVLKRLPDGSRLYGIDRDDAALKAAGDRLKSYAAFHALKGNFFDMAQLLASNGENGVDGILLDLGVSSYQLDCGERGFSYMTDAPLDMRMDTLSPFSAYDVVNGYPLEELIRVIRDYGEEKFAVSIARAIVRSRQDKPVESTKALVEIIKSAMPAKALREAQHPAKRTFQAIRIEVNGELEGLEKAVDSAHDLLKSGGRLAVITFHSLEDRIVKQAFRRYEKPCTCSPKAPICTCGKIPTAKILTKKPLQAGDEEIELNPRSRSAKLRAIEKI